MNRYHCYYQIVIDTLKNIFYNPIVDIVLLSAFFMWLMPYGTFDYTRYEFYICILLAVFIVVTTRWCLRKFQKDFMGKL